MSYFVEYGLIPFVGALMLYGIGFIVMKIFEKKFLRDIQSGKK